MLLWSRRSRLAVLIAFARRGAGGVHRAAGDGRGRRPGRVVDRGAAV